MKNVKQLFRSPIATLLLFVIAAALMLSGTIAGTRAALIYNSENYVASIQMTDDFSATVTENGSLIDDAGLLVGAGESIIPGATYDEVLAVQNTGSRDEYVRVSLYKYWVDQDGKARDLTPDLIHIDLDRSGSWIIDEDASTEERTVLYYSRVLAPGETTVPFATSLTIDEDLASKVTTKTETNDAGYTTISVIYDYNGVSFGLEAEVDGVQSHNAADAILSTWGRDVTVTDGTLSLN